MDVFFVTLEQMLLLFFYIAVGFAFRKSGIVKENLAAVLATLETFVFLPMLCFNTFSTNMTVANVVDKWPIIVVSAVLLVAVYAVSIPTARLFAKDRAGRAIFIYSFVIPNVGYIGYPLVEAVFGSEALFDFMMFCLPLNIFIYTVGINMLTGRTKLSLKTVFNPTIISIIIGSVVGLTGLKMPSLITGITSAGAVCMAPAAMILTGYVLARSPLKKMLANPKMYFAALMRLIVFPAAFGALVWLFCFLTGIGTSHVFLAVTAMCLPMGLNSVVFPEAAGLDGTLGAQSSFISNVLGIITIPLVFALISALGITP